MNTLQKINAIQRPESIHSIHAYTDDESGDLLVDIVAWRTHSQKEEDARFIDLSNTLAEIKSLGVNVEQVGTIDHEEGHGWMYQIKTTH